MSEQMPQAAPKAAMDRWKAAMTEELRPVRPLPGPRVMSLIFWALCTAVALGSAAFLAPQGWRAMASGQRLGVWSMLLAGTGMAAWQLGTRMFPGRRPRVNPYITLPATVAAVLLAITCLMPDYHDADLMGQGVRCLRLGVPSAIGMLVLLLTILRQGAVFPSRPTAAALGFLAGLVSSAMLELHCGKLDRTHVLLTHFSLAVVLGLIGWWRPRWLLRTR